MTRTVPRPRRSGALRVAACLTLAAALAACEGQIGSIDGRATSGGPGANGASDPASGQNSNNSSIDDLQALGCDPTTRGTTEVGVRRLTKPEIIAALTMLFGDAIMKSPSVVEGLGQIPEQSSVANSQFDNDIVDVEGLEAVAATIAGVLFDTPTAASQVLGGCNVANVASCTDALVNGFATKAFRRRPTASTEQSIRTLVSTIGGIEGLKNGIIRVIISPYFHQHLELGENADDCGPSCAPLDPQAPRLRLSSYEVASRLSFQLTGAPPDDALLAAAAAGKLGDLDLVKAQAERLLAAAPARENWRRVASDWLSINQVSDPDAVVAKDLNITNTGLGQEAQEDFRRFVAYEAFDKKSNLHGLFTDHVGFPFTDRLAKAFGVARSDGAQAVDNGLGGLILRPATLMSGTTLTSPILRGVFVKRKILCAQLPAPDANVVKARIDSANLNHTDHPNREYFTLLTSPPVCNGCHSQVNSIGFTMERFGPLGLPRQVETIYDQNGPTGVTHPITTAVDDLHIDDSRAVPASEAADAIEQIAQSSKARACFDAALIINTRYRPLDQTDNCLMSELANIQSTDRPVIDALVQNVANDGIFWKSAKGLQ
jgi:Protein of unknown function (DUF1592)/Protein of unknown function (DUF1588)